MGIIQPSQATLKIQPQYEIAQLCIKEIQPRALWFECLYQQYATQEKSPNKKESLIFNIF